MSTERDRNGLWKLGILLAFGLLVCASAAWGQDACVTAAVPSAFTLPDKSVHAAGRLTVCTIRALTPVVGLHRAWVEGDGASLVMSRIGPAEEKADSLPVIMFRRVAGSPLELVGYEASAGRNSWTYTLQRWDRTGVGETRHTK
jgi:hypothetical protein